MQDDWWGWARKAPIAGPAVNGSARPATQDTRETAARPRGGGLVGLMRRTLRG